MDEDWEEEEVEEEGRPLACQSSSGLGMRAPMCPSSWASCGVAVWPKRPSSPRWLSGVDSGCAGSRLDPTSITPTGSAGSGIAAAPSAGEGPC